MGHNIDQRSEALVIEPLTVRISTAVQLTGISRSRLYELIQAGDLETVKVGRSTLIPYKSLKALTGGPQG
jgi:excisionase family DNA binding protein